MYAWRIRRGAQHPHCPSLLDTQQEEVEDVGKATWIMQEEQEEVLEEQGEQQGLKAISQLQLIPLIHDLLYFLH